MTSNKICQSVPVVLFFPVEIDNREVFHPCSCLTEGNISRVSNQNGVSPLYIMLEIHHPGWEPSIFFVKFGHDTCMYRNQQQEKSLSVTDIFRQKSLSVTDIFR